MVDAFGCVCEASRDPSAGRKVTCNHLGTDRRNFLLSMEQMVVEAGPGRSSAQSSLGVDSVARIQCFHMSWVTSARDLRRTADAEHKDSISAG